MTSLAVFGALVLGSSAASAQQTGAAKNLLVNGSFEKGTDGWTFDGHGQKSSEAVIDPEEKRAGRPTLRMTNVEGNDSHMKQTVAVEPNTRYRLEGYIKTKDVRTVKRDGKGGACLAVEGGFQATEAVSKDKTWTKVSHEFATGEEKEIGIGARLGFFSTPVIGTAWYSDISLTRIGKAPARR